MQNRYAGNVGDFGKYGLLRALCRADVESPDFSLGVVWYLYPHAESNGDGKHVSYLDSSSANDRRFRSCDPSLYDLLKPLVDNGQRSVARVREQRILPFGTRFFEECLTFNDLPYGSSRAARADRRDAWEARALDAMTGCDVVFVDPDNGLEVPSAGRLSNRGPKYVFLDDLRPYLERGQSVVVYHHLSRQGTAEAQVNIALERLRARLGSADPFALLYHRGTARAFLVAPAERQRGVLFDRTQRFLQGWSEHFDLYPRP